MGMFSIFRMPRVVAERPRFNDLDVALSAKAWLDGAPQSKSVMYAIGAFSSNYIPAGAIGKYPVDNWKPVVRRALAHFTEQHNAALIG